MGRSKKTTKNESPTTSIGTCTKRILQTSDITVQFTIKNASRNAYNESYIALLSNCTWNKLNKINVVLFGLRGFLSDYHPPVLIRPVNWRRQVIKYLHNKAAYKVLQQLTVDIYGQTGDNWIIKLMKDFRLGVRAV